LFFSRLGSQEKMITESVNEILITLDKKQATNDSSQQLTCVPAIFAAEVWHIIGKFLLLQDLQSCCLLQKNVTAVLGTW